MISEDKIDKRLIQLSRRMGKKQASTLLSVLGKEKQFLMALETPVGQELLKHAVLAIENKIELILAEKDTQKDRAELQAYLEIIRKWQGIIIDYDKNKEAFVNNSD